MASAAKAKPARPFTMVRRSLWRSRRFALLPDDESRYLFLYYLTCPHQTGTGCMILDDAYALADLAKTGTTWTLEKYRAKKAAIVENGLILADHATGEILVAQWWKDNGPTNESWFAGARKQCEIIESQTLREAAQTALADCWQGFLARKGLPCLESSELGLSAAGAERLAALNNRLGRA